MPSARALSWPPPPFYPHHTSHIRRPVSFFLAPCRVADRRKGPFDRTPPRVAYRASSGGAFLAPSTRRLGASWRADSFWAPSPVERKGLFWAPSTRCLLGNQVEEPAPSTRTIKGAERRPLFLATSARRLTGGRVVGPFCLASSTRRLPGRRVEGTFFWHTQSDAS